MCGALFRKDTAPTILLLLARPPTPRDYMEARGQSWWKVVAKSPGLRRRELAWYDGLRSDRCGRSCPKSEYRVYLAVSPFVTARRWNKNGQSKSPDCP